MAARSAVDKKLWPYVSERGEQAPDQRFELIGARFRRGRQQIGLTQRQVVEEAGISQSIVSRFERGLVRRASAEKIIRLALALGPNFPFGCCPHPHNCAWPANRTAPTQSVQTPNGWTATPDQVYRPGESIEQTQEQEVDRLAHR